MATTEQCVVYRFKSPLTPENLVRISTARILNLMNGQVITGSLMGPIGCTVA